MSLSTPRNDAGNASSSTSFASADDILRRVQLHIDELSSLRLMPPDTSDACQRLNVEAREFSTQCEQFCGHVSSVLGALDELANVVERERLRAVTSRHALQKGGGGAAVLPSARGQSIQQLEVLVREREAQLERLQTELDALHKLDARQREHIQSVLMGG